MGIDRTIRKVLQAGVVLGGTLLGNPARAQDVTPPQQGEFLSKPFQVDDFIATKEGTPDERKKLADQVITYLEAQGDRRVDTKQGRRWIEKVFPINTSSEQLFIRALLFPHTPKLRIVIFRRGNAAALWIDDPEATGIPHSYGMPVEEKGSSSSDLTNRLYFGLLQELVHRISPVH
jgi:hypothetical protein